VDPCRYERVTSGALQQEYFLGQSWLVTPAPLEELRKAEAEWAVLAELLSSKARRSERGAKSYLTQGVDHGQPETKTARPLEGPSSDRPHSKPTEVQMKARARPFAAGLGLAFVAGSAVATPIGGTEILLGLLAVCWIGLPVLLLAALVWQRVRSLISSLRRPLPVMRAPDTDLMA
jgi:hypothetical protein